jgi:O-antigen/teichoic acid export membrane protein
VNTKEKQQETYSLKKVLRGATTYSLGDVLVKASGFFLIPLYTRILTPADYGIVGYLQVFSSLLVVILGFGFYGAQTRYYYEHHNDEQAIGRFMFTINTTTIIASLIVCGPLLIYGILRGWTIGRENIPFHPYMSITLGTVLLSVLNNFVTSSYRMKQKFLGATLIHILTFLLTTGFTILLVVYLKKGALGRVAGNALGLLFIFIPFYYLYARQFKPKFSKEALGYAVGFGFPVVIHLLMGTIHSSIDRLMLERYLPLSELGIYTLGASVAAVLQMFVTAFNQAYQPSYYQLMESGQKTIEKQIVTTFKLWLGLITLATCVGIAFGGPVLTVFAGPRFKEVSKVFPLLLLSVYAGSFYFFFSSPIFFFKKTRILPFITGSSAIINIVINLLLIPRYGINGAAMATIISHIWISVVAYVVGNRLFRVKWPFGFIFMSNIIVSLVFVLSFRVFY